MTSARALTVGSLFSGIGGLDLGLERAGFEIKWQCEIDAFCRDVLARHWPGVRRWDDVTTFLADSASRGLKADAATLTEEVRPPNKKRDNGQLQRGSNGLDSCWRVDLICGGFPCQPVSVAGKRGGDTDDRWLWPEMYRVCSVLRPRWVLVENVPGLLSASSGRLFGGVVRDLAALGYHVEWDCVSAAAVGAPHIRDRVFILADYDRSGCERPSLHISEWESRQAVPYSAWSGSQMADAAERGREGRQLRQTGSTNGPPGGGTCAGSAFTTAGNGIRSDWWATEPDVGRVAHGVPARVDRLRALGNAVVPQVAEFIGRMIVNHTTGVQHHD